MEIKIQSEWIVKKGRPKGKKVANKLSNNEEIQKIILEKEREGYNRTAIWKILTLDYKYQISLANVRKIAERMKKEKGN